jgi:hypothetical protein
MSWFQDMCDEMEMIHGERGWKRRLAEMLGVSDSNIQNWIRAGSAPPIVKTAYEAKREIEDLGREIAAHEHDDFVIEEIQSLGRYRVLKLDPEKGRFLEWGVFGDLGVARRFVQVESGALQAKINAALDCADILVNHADDRQQLNALRYWDQPTRREQKAQMDQHLEEALGNAK